MASVTSLDKDLRKMRLDKYTPQASDEMRGWIERTLGERLPAGDLIDGLKDGTALCKLVNLAVPGAVRFKSSAMPFVQMENISHFLRACQQPPLNLQPHDMFLTVDLYERKDPAQVLQCIAAFSRVANQVNPSSFPEPLGPKSKGVVSPQRTGNSATGLGGRSRGFSNASSPRGGYMSPARTGEAGNGSWSPGKNNSTGNKSPTPATSSWSKRHDEGVTAPAWNIAQYGYMGGASQGNMGISFGGRRQITSAGPHVPTLAEKERMRREKEAEEERQRQQMHEEEEQRRAQRAAEEEHARQEQEARLAEESRRKQEEERRRWEEEERRWKEEDEKRQREDREAEARMEEERRRSRSKSDARLQGQFLSQYQADQGRSAEQQRIHQLEKELELARAREQQYEEERKARAAAPVSNDRERSRSRPRLPPRQSTNNTRDVDEREQLRQAWAENQEQQSAPPKPPRPLPDPRSNSFTRSLPDPAAYASRSAAASPPAPAQAAVPAPPVQNRTDRYLASNPAPPPKPPRTTYANELPTTSEQDGEDRRRVTSQAGTKAGGWASKSLLEREMEMERQRQQEWEEAQKQTAQAVRSGDGVEGIGGGIGGKWDVNQWTGYTGGDSMNRGSLGIGAGRRQIVGPRPPPGTR